MAKKERLFYNVVRAAQEEGEPVSRYIKPILGKVRVSIIDIYEEMPTDIILAGDPTDPELDREDIMVTCWTQIEDDYFRKANKLLLDKGLIAPYSEEIEEEISVNEVTDAELEEALGKPYFAVKALLDKFTSTVPVKRLLDKAVEMNRPVGTINAIKARLSELQQTKE